MALDAAKKQFVGNAKPPLMGQIPVAWTCALLKILVKYATKMANVKTSVQILVLLLASVATV